MPLRSVSRLFLFVFLFAHGSATAQTNSALPSIIHLLLDESSHLEKVLHEYNADSSHIFIAAHRGGRENDVADQAPGNSIANINNAVSKGFDIYESDIEILGDGTLVVFHDDHFNDLTNSTVPDDLLDEADIDYAKSLFLTYSDGSVSGERIPTLHEFLSAIKAKIMVKFDLKSGTFGKSTLVAIMQTAVDTQTTEQVLIRGGSNLLSVAENNGFDTRMIMLKYDSVPTQNDIDGWTSDPPIRAISIPDVGNATPTVAAATNAGLIVEVHESQGVSDQQREEDWQAAIDAGVRQFHSFKPGLLKNYLEQGGYREF